MFSGIVSALGKVSRIVSKNESAELVIRDVKNLKEFKAGESVAVNGVCLTVRDSTKETFTVDLSSETLSRTSFKYVKAGVTVNIERSLMPNDKISGHFVSGHVDCIGTIKSIEHKNGETLFHFEHPSEYIPYIIEKGSVTIDGISLTAFSCIDNGFTASIIPFTFKYTNLNKKKTNDVVNIECDMIGKYIYKACKAILSPTGKEKQISIDLLRRQGFFK